MCILEIKYINILYRWRRKAVGAVVCIKGKKYNIYIFTFLCKFTV